MRVAQIAELLLYRIFMSAIPDIVHGRRLRTWLAKRWERRLPPHERHRRELQAEERARAARERRAVFAAAVGGGERLSAELQTELAARASAVLRREVAPDDLEDAAAELAASLEEHWPDVVEREPTPTPQQRVDRAVDEWARQLNAEVRPSCVDIFFIPPFLVGFIAVLVDQETRVNGWAAVAFAIPCALPLIWLWFWARRRGYVVMED